MTREEISLSPDRLKKRSTVFREILDNSSPIIHANIDDRLIELDGALHDRAAVVPIVISWS